MKATTKEASLPATWNTRSVENTSLNPSFPQWFSLWDHSIHRNHTQWFKWFLDEFRISPSVRDKLVALVVSWPSGFQDSRLLDSPGLPGLSPRLLAWMSSILGEGGLRGGLLLPDLVESFSALTWAEEWRQETVSEHQQPGNKKMGGNIWTHQILALDKPSLYCLHTPPQCTVEPLEEHQ